MKRKHIYIGGTVLLALLGALGGYFLFAGGDDGGGRTGTADGQKASATDETLPIDVLPIADDAFQNVPPVPDGSERYAMGGSQLDASAGYPPPAPGGPSPLPVGGDPNEQPIMNGLPAGETAGEADARSDDSAELGPPAAKSTPAPFDASGRPFDVITRGQEPAAIEAAASDLANPLRASARAAFDVEDGAAEATPVTDGHRYGDTAAGDLAPANGPTGNHASATPLQLPEEDPAGTSIVHSPQADLLPPDETPQTVARDATAPAPITVADDGAMPLPTAATPDQYPDQAGPNDGGFGGLAEPDSYARNGSGIDDAYDYSDAGSGPISRPSTSPYGTGTIAGARAGNVDQDFAGTYGAAGGLGGISGSAGLADVGGAGTGRPGETALEGPQAPQLSVEKIAPDEIQVGKKCTFSVIVRNIGSVAARDVRLVDEIPLGTQLVGTAPRATVLGSQLEWELGMLAPGDEQKVEIALLPVNEGEIGSVATVQFAAAATASAHCTRPLLELVAEMPQSVLIGQQQVVRITLRNPGTGDATGVMLLENVPDGMSHPHGTDLEFEVGTLRAGETRELELVLTAERKGIVQNRIVAKGDGNLFTEDVTQFEVVAPEIAVSVDGPQRKYLELPATFVVAVENPGTAAASDIELVGKLPEGLQFVSADNFGQYDDQTRSVYWSLAELPPRERGEVKLVALPKELGEQRLEVKADAKLGLADRAEAKLQVEGLAAIKSEVTDIADPVEVGGETSYEIRVVNQGSKAATNVQVVAQFPAGVGAIRAEGPTPDPRIAPGQVAFAPLEKLSPKADATYRIDAKGLAPGDQRILVMIMTDDLAAPIKEEESTRVYADR